MDSWTEQAADQPWFWRFRKKFRKFAPAGVDYNFLYRMDVCRRNTEFIRDVVYYFYLGECEMRELSNSEIQSASGGNIYYDIGHAIGGWYAGAVDTTSTGIEWVMTGGKML